MSKFGLAALAVVAALVVSLGVRASTPTAHADVDDTRAVFCGFLSGGIDGDPDDTTVGADIVAACDGISSADVANLGDALGDEDGTLEAADLDDVDLDANQITDAGGANGLGMPLDELLVFAFVDNDGVVTFDAETGVTVEVNVDATGAVSANADADAETCAAPDDLDCDDATLDDGDGVVVARVLDGTADAGDTVDVDVEQDSVTSTETLNIVGTGDDITLTLVETTIQTDADEDVDCTDSDELAVTDSDALGNPDSTIAIAVLTDNDGTALTRETASISTDDSSIADVGATTGMAVDAGDSGTAFFAVLCGQDDTGVTTVTVTGAGEDADADLTVVGAPANVTLAAAPAQIACDGTQTSTVTATVTDADGNAVANGSAVTFSVVALGTANPINTTTTGGTASSTITPLSGATAGVTVIVTAGSASASTRVDCSLPIPTPTGTGPVATPTRSGTIGGPDTGNGGYLGQDSASGFPMWTLVALALGSFALVAGGMVTRRAGK